jgi:hypothetical protein
VFRLLREISPEQVDEWIAFDELEPLGDEKLHAMLALHGANLAAVQGWDLLMSEQEMLAELQHAAQ